MKPEYKVMIIAAEASSSLFALRLLQYWKKERKSIQAFGVGSVDMQSEGFEILGRSEDMAVVGAAEIIEHYSDLKKVFNNLVEEAKKRRPSVVILMDYPEFNLMLAKKLKALGLNIVYYISPQIWAWRKSRVELIKKYCKKVLLLFPFEKAFYDQKNVPNIFVGHPLLDELDDKYFSEELRLIQRSRMGIDKSEIVIGLMPGSRKGEIKQHLDLQLKVARRLCLKYSNIKILLMVAPSRTKEEIQDQMGDLTFPIILLKAEPYDMIDLCDYILAASGTATLQVALLEKPMVIMYRFKWLTSIIAKILVRGVRYFGLPNLIAQEEIVPERWQKQANEDELFRLLCNYIDDPIYASEVKKKLAELKLKLGTKGATKRVAESLEEFFV